MKKIISLFVSFLIVLNCFAYTDWDKNAPLGSINPSTLDTVIGANNEALDAFLKYARFRAFVGYKSTSELYAYRGSVSCSNAAGTVRRLRTNDATISVTWADIDTGSEEVSTTYYVFAVADADASTFTIKISKNNSAPSGSTYCQILGYFYNDSSGNITNVFSYNNSITVSTGTVYDGGTIPLPLGAGNATSFWIVSPYDTSSYMNVIDAGASNYVAIRCYANSSRVVTAQAHNANNNTWYSIYANYLLISINQD